MTYIGNGRLGATSTARTCSAVPRGFARVGASTTVSAAQTVNSLTFKTNGYIITASTLTMGGASVTVDSGVTGTGIPRTQTRTASPKEIP